MICPNFEDEGEFDWMLRDRKIKLVRQVSGYQFNILISRIIHTSFYPFIIIIFKFKGSISFDIEILIVIFDK